MSPFGCFLGRMYGGKHAAYWDRRTCVHNILLKCVKYENYYDDLLGFSFLHRISESLVNLMCVDYLLLRIYIRRLVLQVNKNYKMQQT